jgi:hypothetical protein
MTQDFILQLIVAAAGGVGVYAAIRADLARLGLLAQHAHESAAEAHRRIDNLKGANHG